MGLFTKSNTALDGMSPEAKELARKLNGGGGAAGNGNSGAQVHSAVAAAKAASVLTPPPRSVVTNPPPQTERQLYFQQLKVRIHQQLVERLDVQNLRSLPPDTVRSEVRILIRELCQN